jgi:hypothetical protein
MCTAVKFFFDIAELRMQNKYALNEGVLDKKVPCGKYGLYVPVPQGDTLLNYGPTRLATMREIPLSL